MRSTNDSIARLFHAVVVFGASLSACGGKTSNGAAPSASSEDGSDEATAGSNDAEPSSEPATDSTRAAATAQPSPNAPTGATSEPVPPSPDREPSPTADATPPSDPTDCETPQHFQCADWESRADCHCDEEAPVGAEDCELLIQFECELRRTSEDVLWRGPAGCRCDTRRPNPDSCEHPEQYDCDFNQWYECGCDDQAPLSQDDCDMSPETHFYCRSQDPVYGCMCIVGIR